MLLLINRKDILRSNLVLSIYESLIIYIKLLVLTEVVEKPQESIIFSICIVDLTLLGATCNQLDQMLTQWKNFLLI